MLHPHITITSSLLTTNMNNTTIATNLSIAEESTIEGISLPIACLQAVIMLIIVSGNSLVIAAFARVPKIRSPATQLIVSLASADLLVGFMLLYVLFLTIYHQLRYEKVFCLIRHFLIILTAGNSLINLIPLTAERYVAIMHPFLHQTYVTTHRTGQAILLTWIYVASLSVLGVSFNSWEGGQCEIMRQMPKWHFLILVGHFALFVCVISVAYTQILRVIQGHKKRDRQRNEEFNQKTKDDSKSITIILLVVGSFFVCWMPFNVIICLQSAGVVESYKPPLDTIRTGLYFFGTINSCLNPFIYFWRQKQFRKALRIIVKKDASVSELSRVESAYQRRRF